MLEHNTDVREYGSVPTPQASDLMRAKFKVESILKNLANGGQMHLCYLLKIAGIDMDRFPIVYQWVMGWPLGWTNLNQLETAKFQQWLDSHGRC
jgi:hypothetical protein